MLENAGNTYELSFLLGADLWVGGEYTLGMVFSRRPCSGDIDTRWEARCVLCILRFKWEEGNRFQKVVRIKWKDETFKGALLMRKIMYYFEVAILL